MSALARASERLLRALGAWDRLAPERIGVFREMVVWDATGSGSVHFDAAEVGAQALGFVVENGRLERALARASADSGNVTWYRPARLVDVARGADAVEVRLDGGRRLGARLLVGADGTDSVVRALAGIASDESEYGQRAVVATLESERGHRETAWQRFFPAGPLAFLPLPGRLVSIVWSTTPAHADRLLAAPPAEFAAELEAAVESRLGALTPAGERGAFVLRRLRARAYVTERVALVGDAAHTVHPLAGQGVNLGLLDAAALAEVVVDQRARGRDIGRAGNLRRYERWRKGQNLLMDHTLDGLQRLFASPWPVVRAARNLGLDVTDRTTPLKRLFMRHASGLAGDLPRLARGPAVPD